MRVEGVLDSLTNEPVRARTLTFHCGILRSKLKAIVSFGIVCTMKIKVYL